MDSRFTSRFWPSRRVQPAHERNDGAATTTTTSIHDLNLRGVSYDSVSADARPPTFLLSASQEHIDSDQAVFTPHAFSYNTTKAGKAPTFGGRPLRGNGPVKLQTSRSGRWVEASSDSDDVWEDILDAEYVQPPPPPPKPKMLARLKSARMSSSSTMSSSSLSSLKSTTSQVRLSALPAPKPPVTISPPIRNLSGPSPLLGIPENAPIKDHGCEPCTGRDEFQIPSSPTPPGRQSSQRPRSPLLSSSMVNRLSPSLLPPPPPLPSTTTATTAPGPTGILKNSSKISLVEPRDEQSLTKRALWKAESSRLLSIYGHGGLDYHHPCEQPRRVSGKASMDSPRLEAVYESINDCQDNFMSFPALSGGGIDSSHRDDASDASSRRLSRGSSAITSSTAITEVDSLASRADIHQMVEDMRAIYLQALETREGPLYSVKPIKKSKIKQRSPPCLQSGTPRKSSSPSWISSRPSRAPVATSDISPVGTKVAASQQQQQQQQPLAGMPTTGLPFTGGLPSPDTSPYHARNLDLGRSAGFYRPEVKRPSVRRKRSQRQVRQPNITTTPTSPYKKPNSSLPANATDTQFGDVFSVSIHEFWQPLPDPATTKYHPAFI